jgi:uncharacterized protein YlzI (FlbEa/FlbD family)
MNVIRANQRNFYLAAGNNIAAACIEDVLDHSMNGRNCIVKEESKTEVWNPISQVFETISYSKKVK